MSKITIDKNANLKDITSKIEQDNERLLVKISLSNISGKRISAIKFNAIGYNSFGDIVQVNGQDSFTLLIQDIEIDDTGAKAELNIYIPWSEIRSLDLKENQICYTDGSISTYPGEDVITVEMEDLEKNKKTVIHSYFDSRMKFFPYSINSDEWICGCGRYNNKEKCIYCKNEKTKVFENFSDTNITSMLEKKEKHDLEIKEKTEKEQKRKDKIIRGAFIGFLCVMLIVGIFAKPIVNRIRFSERTLFDSKEEMKKSLQGIYVHYDDINEEEAREAIYINDDKVICSSFWRDEDKEYEISNFNASEGEFEASCFHFVVTKDGDLSWCEKLYKKECNTGEILSIDTSYEKIYDDIDISNICIYEKDFYTYCSGTITNNGDKTYDEIEIEGTFRNNSGEILDYDYTRISDDERLAPGESKYFCFFGQYDDIDFCKVCSISVDIEE